MTILPANPNIILTLAGSLLLLIQFPLKSQNLDDKLTSHAQTSAYSHPTTQLSADSLTSSLAGLSQPSSVARAEDRITESKRTVVPISPLKDNKITKKMLSTFTGLERRFIAAMRQQGQQYFPVFEQLLKQYGLPDELKYISVIESGLNYNARSRCQALGRWQFMSATGKQYQLYQDAYIDERLDPYKATEAACRYLKDLYQRFGNWELVLAAYNCGSGNVRKAIRRSGNQTSFWKIASYLPSEARAYVPKFAVVHHLMTQGLSDTLSEDGWCQPQRFDTILVSQYVDMKQLARQLDMSLEALVQLNPQVKRNVIPGYLKDYVVKIPTEKKAFFDLYRSSILASVVSIQNPARARLACSAAFASHHRRKVVHQVSRGEVLGSIAAKYQVRVSDIRRWNRLRSRMIKIKQSLVIWVAENPVVKAYLTEDRTTSGKVNPSSVGSL